MGEALRTAYPAFQASSYLERTVNGELCEPLVIGWRAIAVRELMVYIRVKNDTRSHRDSGGGRGGGLVAFNTRSICRCNVSENASKGLQASSRL